MPILIFSHIMTHCQEKERGGGFSWQNGPKHETKCHYPFTAISTEGGGRYNGRGREGVTSIGGGGGRGR